MVSADLPPVNYSPKQIPRLPEWEHEVKLLTWRRKLLNVAEVLSVKFRNAREVSQFEFVAESLSRQVAA